jgi:hypothetical protein
MGTLVIYDIFKGPKKEHDDSSFNYPVLWASDSSMSFLISQDHARKLLKDTGFRELIWEDKTASALEWFNQIIKHSETAGPPPPIGMHTIVGPQWQTMVKNLINNFEEGFVVIAQGVFERH